MIQGLNLLLQDITLPDRKSISDDTQLLKNFNFFERFWKSSPYHLGDGVSKKGIFLLQNKKKQLS